MGEDPFAPATLVAYIPAAWIAIGQLAHARSVHPPAAVPRPVPSRALLYYTHPDAQKANFRILMERAFSIRLRLDPMVRVVALSGTYPRQSRRFGSPVYFVVQ